MCSAFSLEVIMAEKKTTRKKIEKAAKNPQVRFNDMVWEVIGTNSSGDLQIRNATGTFMIRPENVEQIDG